MEFPTCKEHGLLKPCQHCVPHMTVPGKAVICGDAEAKDNLERCDCGCLKAIGRPCGFTRYKGSR